MYNTTGIVNATTTGALIDSINQATGGVLFGSFSVALFFILLIVTKRTGTTLDALMVSSFSCFLITALLAYGGFINLYYCFVYFIVMAISVFWSQTHQE